MVICKAQGRDNEICAGGLKIRAQVSGPTPPPQQVSSFLHCRSGKATSLDRGRGFPWATGELLLFFRARARVRAREGATEPKYTQEEVRWGLWCYLLFRTRFEQGGLWRTSRVTAGN
jgi:hypothetical protein